MSDVAQKTKTVTRYEIRHYPAPTSYSRSMSPKLRTRTAAARLVKRLKRSGVDAFSVSMKVCVAA